MCCNAFQKTEAASESNNHAAKLGFSKAKTPPVIKKVKNVADSKKIGMLASVLGGNSVKFRWYHLARSHINSSAT